MKAQTTMNSQHSHLLPNLPNDSKLTTDVFFSSSLPIVGFLLLVLLLA